MFTTFIVTSVAFFPVLMFCLELEIVVFTAT